MKSNWDVHIGKMQLGISADVEMKYKKPASIANFTIGIKRKSN